MEQGKQTERIQIYTPVVDDTITKLIETYRETDSIRIQNGAALPCRRRIEQIVEHLREMIFPGFFCRELCVGARIHTHLRKLSSEIYGDLSEQIFLSLTHTQKSHGKFIGDLELAKALFGETVDQNTLDNLNSDDIYLFSKKTTAKFLSELPNVRRTLVKDVEAAYLGDPAASDNHEIILAYPGLTAITLYRLAHILHNLSVPMLPRIICEYAHTITGIDIHPAAQIGNYFFIDHGTGVVIGETCIIGDNVKIYQGVTLGAISTRGGQRLSGIKRHPTLENNVTVYSGTSILGGDTIIGEGSTIGGNLALMHSVPPHTQVILKEPELIFKDMNTRN